LKVVIDTSVVVSAALKDRVPEEVILFVLAQPEFTWIASAEIIGEYAAVLKRAKFNLPAHILEEWQRLFERHITLVETPGHVDFPRDRKDAIFLACALSTRADYLITGDKDFQEARKAGVTTVISIADFKRLIIQN